MRRKSAAWPPVPFCQLDYSRLKHGQLIAILVIRRSRLLASASKVMATVFWDSEGIVLIDYLEHGNYYRNLLPYADLIGKCREALKEKRRGKL